MLKPFLLVLTLGGVAADLALAAPAPVVRNFGLSEPQRRAIWTHTMRGQLSIAEQTQDEGLTRMLSAETKGEKRTAQSASLSCALMSRIDAQAARQPPLIDELHARIRRAYGLSQAALDGILREGEQKGWALPL
ncbi:hypothetical protein ACINK0_13580 [Deinococcus sp. VB343]|uniref:hypothetical protein n=1 Tax=Deinococcus sp. VB343 TaxID=3385567 RepID=UPI0039C96FDA